MNLELERYSLDNGLRVVLGHDDSAPLVAVNLWYHVGSKNERRGRTGFAHLFEHMLFSGSENVGNNEHFRYVQSVGGTLNGSTTFDRTNYYETLPSNVLELALWLESDRMGFFLPALTQEKLDVQKNVVQEERRLRYDNAPYGTAFEELLRLAFPDDYPYHWPTIGSMDDIAAASLDDVKEFFATWYRPNNAVLTVAGDFDRTEARALIDRYFGEIPPAELPRATVGPAPRLTGERRAAVEGDVQLPRIYRLYHFPSVPADGWFAGDVLMNLLASGKASRLDRRLVYEREIAHDVAAFVFPSESTGLGLLWVTGREGTDVEELERALDEEIDALLAEGIGQQELDRARNQIETDYAHQLESLEMRADLLGMFETFLGDAGRVSTLLDHYRALSIGAVDDAARSLLPKERSATLLYLPRSGNGGEA